MKYYISNDMYGSSLEHFGVPGMKWGVRKARPVGNGRRESSHKGNSPRLLRAYGNHYRTHKGPYKNHPNYKNLSKADKIKLNKRYDKDKWLGEKAANKLALAQLNGKNYHVKRGKIIAGQYIAGLMFADLVVTRGSGARATAKFVKGSVKKTAEGFAKKKATAEATKRIEAKVLKKVGKNVYKWV